MNTLEKEGLMDDMEAEKQRLQKMSRRRKSPGNTSIDEN